MSLDGISFNLGAGKVKHSVPASGTEKVAETKVSPIQITGTNTTQRSDLSGISDISNRAKLNSPEANGLASAQGIEKGQLVSGFYFDKLGEHDARLFALKYNSANTPSIAKGISAACDGIEYAGVAGNLQAAAKNSPFAELFA